MGKLKTGERKRPGGGYEKRFTIKGVRYSVYAERKEDLQAKEDEKRAQIKAGIYHTNETITLSQYFDEWIEGKALSVRPITVYLYQRLFRKFIRRTLGRHKVRTLERRQIVNLMNHVADTAGIATANKVHTLIGSILKGAMADDIIQRNVAAGIPAIKQKGPAARETIHRELTDSEIEKVFSMLKGSIYYTAYRFLLNTGTRAGECAALQWKDVDRTHNIIHIRRTMTKDREGKWILGETTKTKTSRRDIPMNQTVRKIIDYQWNLYRDLKGIISPCDFVFPSSTGGHTNTTALEGSLRAAIRKYNEHSPVIMKFFSVHAFRDTFASRAIRAGVPPNTLKEILGHASLSMTMDLYAHVSQGDKRQAMEKLQEVSF